MTLSLNQILDGDSTSTCCDPHPVLPPKGGRGIESSDETRENQLYLRKLDGRSPRGGAAIAYPSVLDER